jgi:hypothetical protein
MNKTIQILRLWFTIWTNLSIFNVIRWKVLRLFRSEYMKILQCYRMTKIIKYIHVFLQVHPLLRNELVNKFPWGQMLGKQSVDRSRNNRWDCFLCGRRQVTIEQRVIQSVSKQRNYKHVYNNRCSLCTPCRRFIGDSEGRLRSVVASHSREPVSQGHEAVMERSCEHSAVKY